MAEGSPVASDSNLLVTIVSLVAGVLPIMTFLLADDAPVWSLAITACLVSAIIWRAERLRADGMLDRQLTAATCLLVVVLVGTVRAVSQAPDRPESDADVTDEMARLRDANSELEDQVSSLRSALEQVDAGTSSPQPAEQSTTSVALDDQEVGQGSTASSPPPDGAPDGTTSGHDVGPGVHNSGNVLLPSAARAMNDWDFDEWSGSPDESPRDLMIDVDGRILSTTNGAIMAASDTATFAACSAASSWVTTVDLASVEASDSFCFRTSDRRLGVMTMTSVFEDEDRIRFRATVWVEN